MIRIYSFIKIYILILAALFTAIAVTGQELRQLASRRPDAVADLKTDTGISIMKARWYRQNAEVTSAAFFLPGPQANGGDNLNLYPTGRQTKTNLVYPQQHNEDFEKGFSRIKPEELESRAGNGLLSFVWYKVEITIPENIGNVETAGTRAVFEIVMDDYSEIWVNGKQQVIRGQQGEGVISGFNSRNRVVLTESAIAGEIYRIHILGINGPIGKLPENYIWVRNAYVDFYRPEQRMQNSGSVTRIDEKLDAIISPDAIIEKVADGFEFTEGPVWHPDGYLLFSDPNTNTIYRYEPVSRNVSVHISHSGYSGADIDAYHQPGSNGLAIDAQGRLIVAQHGNRRIIRHEPKGPVTVISDNYQGKRLNSPNDLVITKDGTIYFTDPPYGLPGLFNDPKKETPHQGVYMVKDGKTILLATDAGGPNGIAFSPDEKFLYVSNWDVRNIQSTKTLWRYEVNADGTLRNGKIFYDWNHTSDQEALDGVKVDRDGNLFVSAPGGVYILDNTGKLLGQLTTPQRPANMAWGDDGKTLYMTAHSVVYKVRTHTGINLKSK